MTFIAAPTRVLADSPSVMSGSWPGTPGYAFAAAAMMIKAAALKTAGFIEISRPRSLASAKRAPHLARLLRAHALEHEREIERVAPPDLHLLAPMLVAQFLAVEEQKVLEQILEGGIGLRDDAAVDCAEVIRERMRSQRHPRDDSKRTAAPAAQSPEEILVLATVCDQHPAVGGDHFRLEHARRSDSIFLRPASEPAALHESASGSDRGAAASLDVTAVLDGHLLVRLEPARPRFESHRRCGRRRSGTLGDQAAAAAHLAHWGRPPQNAFGPVGGPGDVGSRPLDPRAQSRSPGEFHRRADVRRNFRGDCTSARSDYPRDKPAGGLLHARLILEIERVRRIADGRGAGLASRVAPARRERRLGLLELA